MEKNKTKYSNTMIMSVSCGYVKWIMVLEKFMVFSISMLRCCFSADWIGLSKRIISIETRSVLVV